MISLLQLHAERKSVFLVGHGDTDGVCSIEGGGWSATEVVEENYADCSSHFPSDRMATAEGAREAGAHTGIHYLAKECIQVCCNEILVMHVFKMNILCSIKKTMGGRHHFYYTEYSLLILSSTSHICSHSAASTCGLTRWSTYGAV